MPNETAVALPALLRIIQSVPSPKAEPIKLWPAKVGYERIQDIERFGVSDRAGRAPRGLAKMKQHERHVWRVAREMEFAHV